VDDGISMGCLVVFEFQTAASVIASEAKQSIFSLRRTMDCFASLAMT